MRVFGFGLSTWTRTVQMTCHEKGVAFETVPVSRTAGVHPFGRIPALEHGDVRLFESLAICGYLDEAFPGPALQPEALEDRTRMRCWMSICGDYLFRDVVRTIPRDRPATDAERTTARTALERADALVDADLPFLAGSELTLADLYLAPQIANALEKAPDLLDGLEGLRLAAERMAARASFTATTYDPAEQLRLIKDSA